MLLKQFFARVRRGMLAALFAKLRACSIALEPQQQSHPFAVRVWSAFAVLLPPPPA